MYTAADLKPLCWLGSSRAAVRAFPDVPRRVVGHELFQVQRGLTPTSWKPFATVGAGVVELRVDVEGAFRVLYVARFPEAVYVLHAFEKKTRRTPPAEVKLARKRFRDLERSRTRPPRAEMGTRVHRSSGNVFRDLGFGAEEAENLRLRSELMIQIRKLIEGRSLTQAAAARLFGVTQPRVSDLMRGRIDLFSIDGLVKMLARAGVRVQLALKRGSRVA